jgi:hypothetical protein
MQRVPGGSRAADGSCVAAAPNALCLKRQFPSQYSAQMMTSLSPRVTLVMCRPRILHGPRYADSMREAGGTPTLLTLAIESIGTSSLSALRQGHHARVKSIQARETHQQGEQVRRGTDCRFCNSGTSAAEIRKRTRLRLVPPNQVTPTSAGESRNGRCYTRIVSSRHDVACPANVLRAGPVAPIIVRRTYRGSMMGCRTAS